MHRIDHAANTSPRLGAGHGGLGATGYIRDGFCCGGSAFGDALHTRIHGIGCFELERIGYVTDIEIHALERVQGHFLHLQRLDGGAQGAGVLLQPEMHVFEFFDALVQLFHVQRRRNPIAQVGHLRDVVARAFGQILQKIKAGYKFSETCGV